MIPDVRPVRLVKVRTLHRSCTISPFEEYHIILLLYHPVLNANAKFQHSLTYILYDSLLYFKLNCINGMIYSIRLYCNTYALFTQVRGRDDTVYCSVISDSFLTGSKQLQVMFKYIFD